MKRSHIVPFAAACTLSVLLNSNTIAQDVSSGSSGWAIALAQNVQRPPMSMEFEIDGQVVRVEVDADGVEFQMDGRVMSKDRYLELSGGKAYKFLDRHGTPVGHLRLLPNGMNVWFDRLAARAYLGVDVQPIGEALAEHLQLDPAEVAHIVSVKPKSPAEKGGLLKHDIVTSIDGRRGVTAKGLHELLGKKKPGDTIPLVVLRRGENKEFEIELGRAPGGTVMPFSASLDLRPGDYSFDFTANGLPQGWYKLGDEIIRYTPMYQQPTVTNLMGKGFQATDLGVDATDPSNEQVDRLERRLDELEKLIRQLCDRKDN